MQKSGAKNWALPAILAGIVLLTLVTNIKKYLKMSRGLRNNNPFNIRVNHANNWKGKIPYLKNTDKDFEQFESLEYGIRAGLILLKNYVAGGHNTVKKIISKYSPQSDPGNAPGSTNNYISYVSDGMDIDSSSTIIRRGDIPQLAYYITKFENGKEVASIYDFESIGRKYSI